MSQNEKLTGILLNGKNYFPWTRSITLGLSGRSKLEYITGELEKPKPNDPTKPDEAEKKAMKEWQANDHLIMSWMIASVEQPIADLLIYANSAKEMWDKAERQYGHRNNYAHLYQLQEKIHQARQQNKSVTEVMSYLQKLKDELKVYRPPTTDLAEIQKREEQDEVFQFLACLDSSFESVISQILLSATLPFYEAITAMIQRKESMREVMNP